MYVIFLTGIVILLSASNVIQPLPSGEKETNRIIISTDIGGDDPDDFQSMVHLMMYADRFDIEGLISSPPGKGRKSDIDTVIDLYAKDYRYLSKASGGYPPPRALRKVSMQGAVRPQAGETPDAFMSAGAAWIVKKAMEKSRQPLYILVWGSLTDVAQAVHNSPEIKKHIRIYSIGSWNTLQDPKARDYLYENHPDLWWIESNTTFRGMYLGGDQQGEWGNVAFVRKFVKDHGELGRFFFLEKPDIKMGDTPSVLYMLNGDPGNPEGESWGGSYVKTGHGNNYWSDNPDPLLRFDGKNGARTVSKWRVEFLEDWATRMLKLPVQNL